MEVPKEIKKINEVTWEIPTSYKEGMNVPARIIATEKLLNQMDRGVFDQVTNVACLPGIVKYAYCMPDAHWGYGSPVGGLAAFDLEKGVISPGIIGFDINCVHPETKILSNYGYFKKIINLNNLDESNISFLDLKNNKKNSSSAVLFLRKKVDKKVLKIKTRFGEEIILSEDHPLYNGQLFQEAGVLKKGDKLVTHPFFGVEYQEPTEKIILDEEDIVKLVGNRKKLIKELKNKGLLPLKENSKKLPLLARLVGFLTGDGWLGSYYSKKRKMDIWSMRVIGNLKDLEEIKDDLRELGYNANYTQTNNYISNLKEIDGSTRTIDGSSNQLYINSQSLSVLLHALGIPKGNKSRIKVNIPFWINESPLWIKRLYLSGLFGAELTKPAQRKGENFGFIEPSFSQNKINALETENMNFILEIINLLLEFGVNTNNIYKQKGIINSYGEETHKLSLRISTKPNNLVNLWGKIGYEYCGERKELSSLALAYLKYKKNILYKMKDFISRAKEQFNKERSYDKIYSQAEEFGISKSMIKAQISRNSKEIMINKDFPTFQYFSNRCRILDSQFILDEIENIEEIDYDGYLYDITMNDSNHNFIANSIVSHNCGMRSILTNLTFKEVQPKLKLLVDTLFKTVPAGVGAKGFVNASKKQFNEVMENGSKWCVENDYGWKEDLDRTEGYGKIDWADSSKVSQKAVYRGINQLGTLGSGNHYLEIQHIKEEEIYDKKAAKKFGIFKNQVVVMIHCGSRGMGHQVATDYLQTFDKVMQENNIKIRDRELSCAPFHTKEGQDYYKAMACAANMAFANRQVIMHRVREAFEKVFNKSAEELEMHLVYDVAHNVAKIEEHKVDGKKRKLIVHRKGATRAFPPGHEELAPMFRETGQVVVIGGSMQTGSALLLGTKEGESTFYTSAHGSGRTMSRTQARHEVRGEKLQKEMEEQGIYVKSVSMSGLAEEAGVAYKDLSDVLDSVVKAKIGKLLCVMRPIGNLKG